VQHKRKFIF